jgi:hypothetical protein
MNTQPVRQVTPVLIAAVRKNWPVEKLAFVKSDGTPFDPSVVNVATGVLTGYTAHAVGNVAATDTVNIAIAKLEARIAVLEAG